MWLGSWTNGANFRGTKEGLMKPDAQARWCMQISLCFRNNSPQLGFPWASQTGLSAAQGKERPLYSTQPTALNAYFKVLYGSNKDNHTNFISKSLNTYKLSLGCAMWYQTKSTSVTLLLTKGNIAIVLWLTNDFSIGLRVNKTDMIIGKSMHSYKETILDSHNILAPRKLKTKSLQLNTNSTYLTGWKHRFARNRTRAIQHRG